MSSSSEKIQYFQDDEYGGLFTSYADPSRNIAVGDTKAELSAVMRGRVEGRYSFYFNSGMSSLIMVSTISIKS